MGDTFMDFEPNTDWSVSKPKTQDAATAIDFDLDGILDTSWTNPTNATDQSALRIFNEPQAKGSKSGFDFDFGEMFSGENIGGTLQGIGAIGGALASIYGIREQSKFNDDMLDMEKKRVNKEYEKAEKKQTNYDKVWKS